MDLQGQKPVRDQGVSHQKPSARIPDQLTTEIYSHLRAIAQMQMQNERVGHTLTATALVHEAYVRVASADGETLDPNEFYQSAACAMRRILIDHARRRGAAKRGGRVSPLGDIGSILDLGRDDHLDTALALDQALEHLEQHDPGAAAVVRLRFFAGITGRQAADALGISPRQADREWAYARAYLLDELAGGDGEAQSNP